jgi:pimeloyl-ACP methyl ester carboxylesterase
MKTDTLKVPGASLYYEVRGSGPVLLLMPGGPADATTFRRIENHLASKYTVVTYDPRGLSHSQPDEPIDDARMVETFADDVHRLLDKVAGGRKACVFANSGGAVIALELAKRHPEQLDIVVIHEPPSPTLQPKPAEIRAAMEHVCETCATAGLWAAVQEFMALVGVQGGPPPAPQGEPTPEQQEAMAMMQKNMEFFLGRYVRNIARYQPDLDALKECSCTIVPAIGAESTEGQLARTGGLGLASMLGKNVTVFPGDHGGFDGRPVEFAAKLLEVLEV